MRLLAILLNMLIMTERFCCKNTLLQTQVSPSMFPTGCAGRNRLLAYTVSILWFREIKKYQKSTELLVPKAPMRRLIAELTADILNGHPRFNDSDIKAFRWKGTALLAVQEAVEDFVVGYVYKKVVSSSNGLQLTCFDGFGGVVGLQPLIG